MKDRNKDSDWDLSSDYHAMQSYGKYLIRSAIEEAGACLAGYEIREVFEEEMERRYGKEA